MKQRGRKSQYDMYGNPQLDRRFYGGQHLVETAAPEHLGAPERQLWKDICAGTPLETAASIATLTIALEGRQRARECREVIEVEGMQITDRFQQPRAHPLLIVERNAWSAWLAGIRALGLEL